MDASILIPTHGRHEKLSACLGALAQQTWSTQRFEVVVGIDGEDHSSLHAATNAWIAAGGHPQSLVFATLPKHGYIHVRHRLIPTLTGHIYISLNDDVIPCPDFVERHLAAHAELQRSGRSGVIVGHSPFIPWARPTLLDALVAETSMVFFYDVMDDSDPNHDWGFRHCFGLNFSAPLENVVAAGGVHDVPDTYGYDDIELAYRLGLPVLFRPDAVAPHDHRYQPIDLLRREFALGVASVRFAMLNPDFGHALFGRDILDPRHVEYASAFVKNERPASTRIERSFLGIADIPDSTIGGPARRSTLRLLSQQFLLLKRYIWRQGLLAELEGRGAQYTPLSAEHARAA